ncbi:MAG: ATP-binding cassette domain-containing protein [Clostridiaceae bacterium]|nr:ATP-binding cassette domain-containing protein [Clostridiaceae bacterium]
MGLKISNVNKSYGDKKVVDNINLQINNPGVFGLLGTNGAGKTTTIRMLLGILKKDSGEITWNDKKVERKHVNFGYLPEERGIYPKTKIYDQLVYFAKLKGMTTKQADKAIDYWMKRLEVEQYKNMTAEKLSKGNQQKIQFITAILHDPELVVLDEPFSGLDPVNTELLRNIILELVNQGKYIIMSAHQMSVVEEFCTDILILNKGKTVLQGNLKQIKDTYKANKLSIISKDDIEEKIKEANLSIIFKKENEYQIKITENEETYKLLESLVKNNIKVEKFEINKPSLHDIFIEKVGE